jgi:uncharacterized protein
MEQRLSLVTLAVADRARSRAFYLDGLGWEAAVDEQDVLMFTVADRVLLSLWEESSFEAEVGPVRRGPGLAPITLAHNCRDRAAVDDVLDDARAAGADPVETASDREWGGYSGYFADPDGYRWEVAWAPGDFARLMVPDSKEHG